MYVSYYKETLFPLLSSKRRPLDPQGSSPYTEKDEVSWIWVKFREPFVQVDDGGVGVYSDERLGAEWQRREKDEEKTRCETQGRTV